MQMVETEHLTSRAFVAAKYKGISKYPNLVELHKYYPCGEPAMCDHARIEPELLHLVLYDGASLEFSELLGLARLYNCPVGVLECRVIIMLDTMRLKHRKMIAEVDNLYTQLKYMAREGSQKATSWLKWAEREQQRFLMAAHNKSLSYCHYLGAKEQIRQYISFSTPKPRGRDIVVTKEGQDRNGAFNSRSQHYSISQETMPEHFKGRTIILCIKDQNCVILTSRKKNTPPLNELIKERLEIRINDYDVSKGAFPELGLTSLILEIWRTLGRIYEKRKAKSL